MTEGINRSQTRIAPWVYTWARMVGYGLIRGGAGLMGLIGLWHLTVMLTGVPFYMLPPPLHVLTTTVDQIDLLFFHARVTGLEMVLGLGFGVWIGFGTAVCMVVWHPLKGWLLPILVVSQALPVFAIAPLLVLWLGYGLASKVAMAALIIYFPVTVALYDGLRHVPRDLLDQAYLMTGAPPWKQWRVFAGVLIPAAWPVIGAGLRTAAAVVPIGAVVGEWVGSSAGLGHLMLVSNAKMQTDLMFSALFCLACLGLIFYSCIDWSMRILTRHHTA